MAKPEGLAGAVPWVEMAALEALAEMVLRVVLEASGGAVEPVPKAVPEALVASAALVETAAWVPQVETVVSVALAVLAGSAAPQAMAVSVE